MNDDERKLLEDRIYEYGTAVSEGKWKGANAAWDRLMDDLTKIQKRGERDD